MDSLNRKSFDDLRSEKQKKLVQMNSYKKYNQMQKEELTEYYKKYIKPKKKEEK